MELIDYIRMLRRRWAWVVVLSLLGTAVGVVYAFTAPKTYRATAELFVGISVNERTGSPTDAAQKASQFTLDRMQSYAGLVDSPEVVRGVIVQLGLSMSAEKVEDRLSADVSADTVLLGVAAEDDEADTAAALANAAAGRLSSLIEELETPSGTIRSPVRVTVIDPATSPDSPASPNRPLAIALGVIVGLGLGVLAAAVREQAERTPSDAFPPAGPAADATPVRAGHVAVAAVPPPPAPPASLPPVAPPGAPSAERRPDGEQAPRPVADQPRPAADRPRPAAPPPPRPTAAQPPGPTGSSARPVAQQPSGPPSRPDSPATGDKPSERPPAGRPDATPAGGAGGRPATPPAQERPSGAGSSPPSATDEKGEADPAPPRDRLSE